LIWVRYKGLRWPTWSETSWSAMTGLLILGVANGALTFAEQIIPSSLAALFVSLSPFWMVGIDSTIPGGEKFRAPTGVGMLIGLCGVGLLLAPGLGAHGLQGDTWKGFLLLQLASASWSLGSILQKRRTFAAHPFAQAGVQQLVAGLAYVLPAIFLSSHHIEWSARGTGALLYLVVFGSLVGYTAYLYALNHLPIAIVSLYTYINPVVAAILGYVFYREPFGWLEISAMAVIFLGVAVVKRFNRH
jgi:drug/metabolite transporter (DMT)-like permease